jgi:hypothetical protein
LELPISEAISVFELRPDDFVAELEARPGPRFGDVDRDLWLAGFRHIVVEVGAGEGRRAKWRPGFYRSRVKPDDAFGKLIEHALAAELGKNNVIRVELEPATDTGGGAALKITVVIAPNAIKRLEKGAALDALVRLRERLRAMQDYRTPIVEYATEAELAQDAGP